MSLLRFLYNLLLIILMPFVWSRWLWRSVKLKGYRERLSERLGLIPIIASPHTIWIHAASVGEMIAATPLVKTLLQRYSNDQFIITTTTPTASAQVQKIFANTVHHYYLPYDLPCSIKRFLRAIHPRLAIIMETELWPNLLYYTHKNGTPILLANARLSERSLQGYQKIRLFMQPVLSCITHVAAQSKSDGERFIQLGVSPDSVFVTGNIKFDLNPADFSQEGALLRATWGTRPVIIAASTHEGEESVILEAFEKIRRQYTNALLMIVPRHPERFTKVARLCEVAGFSVAKRSLGQIPDAQTAVFLGDTMGECRLFYAASDIAFVGGSLVPIGGHNLIEPAAARLPILSGKYLHNFTAISQLLLEANALIIINTAEELARQILQLLANPSECAAMGERAYAVSTANTGALDKHLAWIDNCLP